MVWWWVVVVQGLTRGYISTLNVQCMRAWRGGVGVSYTHLTEATYRAVTCKAGGRGVEEWRAELVLGQHREHTGRRYAHGRRSGHWIRCTYYCPRLDPP